MLQCAGIWRVSVSYTETCEALKLCSYMKSVVTSLFQHFVAFFPSVWVICFLLSVSYNSVISMLDCVCQHGHVVHMKPYDSLSVLKVTRVDVVVFLGLSTVEFSLRLLCVYQCVRDFLFFLYNQVCKQDTNCQFVSFIVWTLSAYTYYWIIQIHIHTLGCVSVAKLIIRDLLLSPNYFVCTTH